MAPFRSVADILIGLGIISAIVLLFAYVPHVLGFTVVAGMSCLLAYVMVRSLWHGHISINSKYRFSNYSRHKNPIAFWFYICLILAVLAAMLSALTPMHW
jgi:hypothetical protein